MTMASAADLDFAQALGRATGILPDEQGGSCPYTHATIEMRVAWFTGFGEGRAALNRQHAPDRAGLLSELLPKSP